MKILFKVALATLALSASSAFATNGINLIGTGTKAVGMGGASIGTPHGAENILNNPSLISSVKSHEVSVGANALYIDFKSSLMGGKNLKSRMTLPIVPSLALANKETDHFWWGFGVLGVSGVGVDFRTAPGSGFAANMHMSTAHQIMQTVGSLAYKMDNGFGIGITPIFQYGILDINYNAGGTAAVGGISQSATKGVAQSYGGGYNVGLSYEAPMFTVGLVYKSPIDMIYKGQIEAATTQFSVFGTAINSDHLEQPEEMGFGVSAGYKHKVSFDFKQIRWGEAKGYKQFHWENQNVFIIGYQYQSENWAARLGYNYGKNQIKEQNGATAQGALENLINLLGFPGLVEHHYTVGGTYNFSKMTSVDMAYVYVPRFKYTYDISAFGAGAKIVDTANVGHASFQLNYKF